MKTRFEDAEGGLLLGLPYIILRIVITFWLFRESCRSLPALNTLPILLFGAGALGIFGGILAQPSYLGLTVFVSGLCLAATNMPERQGVSTK